MGQQKYGYRRSALRLQMDMSGEFPVLGFLTKKNYPWDTVYIIPDGIWKSLNSL
jgi:hypothetical protein